MVGFPASREDVWFEEAKRRVLEIVREQKVVTDRELKVRLEGNPFPAAPGPFPWVVGRAVKALMVEGVVKPHGYRGRRRIGGGVPNIFYALPGVPYSELEPVIQRKRRISADVNNLLRGRLLLAYLLKNCLGKLSKN